MSEDKSVFEEREVKKIEELQDVVSGYMTPQEVELFGEVYEYAKNAHEGQVRKSGEPYITHPLAVSGILAHLKLDFASVATGLLHDTVEDTDATLDEISKKFGEDVAFLVDGVTKISQMSFRNTQEKQGENIRKMIVSMGRDVRVILVKLCDRLHNMRTMKYMSPEKQEKIALETLDIYAPLASRLGINWLKIELEDLSFHFSNPRAYYDLVQKVQKKKKERDHFIADFKAILIDKISKSFKDQFEVQGRSKHLYSIHKKMMGGVDYDQIYDVLAFRVLVDSMPQCYEILGLVHAHLRPVPGRFKDFIAMPKNNSYQSLHTTVVIANGDRVEIQIRTKEMHLIAEQGIAAHWSYKQSGADKGAISKFNWLRELISMHQQLEDSKEFLEGVKTDLFDQEIYVFTPKGEVKELPENSTPIDFAYAIHTDLGSKCVGARVNGKMVSIRHKLQNGDYVEVVTSKSQAPSKDWLNFCVTSRARSKIRYYIKTEQRKKAMEIGQGLLDKVFKKTGLTPQNYKKKHPKIFGEALRDFGCQSLEELQILLGYGKVYSNQVSEKILKDVDPPEEEGSENVITKAFNTVLKSKKSKSSLVIVDGMSNILVHFGKCCHPIPGDDIVGFITRGRGIVVHRADCTKIYDLDPQRELEVQWGQIHADTSRVVKLYITLNNQMGVLNRITELLKLKGIDIQNAQVKLIKDQRGVAYFDIYIKDKSQLSQLIMDIKKLPDILDVKRM